MGKDSGSDKTMKKMEDFADGAEKARKAARLCCCLCVGIPLLICIIIIIIVVVVVVSAADTVSDISTGYAAKGETCSTASDCISRSCFFKECT